MARWLRALILFLGWLVGAAGVHLAAAASPWTPWITLPPAYGAYAAALHLLRRLPAAGEQEPEETSLEELLADFVVFAGLGLAAVPLLERAAAAAGGPLSPAVPAAAAYAVYALWPRDGR
ncbi:MAG: hypothetical protein FWJ62_07960 [Thermaerobacter sp.]|nr:hypothetical protein [Bacillota bacterium]